ncbi:TetR family transcriptional regulator [Actinoplanes sp. KI2]|uniref:TetR/AcrR family transcriptional regulator n=1 Tax=Actinoplanes sp. KI2 TaxID=2983315 RepID=UPI0021D5FDE6|nr:TetR family transcriptional regulator [Actinoplanes sp. KI2]MCU7726901.1 TetR family transcriptional regulator [Actinoplanes sp. KI2]
MAVRRSDATRAAILVAARERFASDGYERATIRSIAADADIDPSMVMRYYGSKEKLFAAAAEFDLQLPDASAIRAEEIGAVLARHFLHRWEGDDTLTALLRAAATNEAAADRMRDLFGAQLLPVVAAVCPDPADAPRRAGLVASQMLGLALCRFVLRLPPMVAMPAEEAAGWVGPTIQRYLTSAS